MINYSLDLSQYTLLNKIETDENSSVYKIKNNSTDLIYSAKLLFNSKKEEEEEGVSSSFNQNFTYNINIISKLNHPSIAKFVGFSPINFQGSPNPIIITEYISNGTLKDIILSERKSKADFNWNDTKKLIALYGLASAMLYLHSHNVIHHDLRPENILMDDKLYPKISIYNLLKPNVQNSQDEIKSSILYSSPEKLTNQVPTKESDVFSFSMIAYEVMTSQEPFIKSTFSELRDNIISGNRPDFTFSIPEAYKNLIEKCWSQKPSDRPTFVMIVDELRTNREFITEMVEEDEFLCYVDSLDEFKEENQQELSQKVQEDDQENQEEMSHKTEGNLSSQNQEENQQELKQKVQEDDHENQEEMAQNQDEMAQNQEENQQELSQKVQKDDQDQGSGASYPANDEEQTQNDSQGSHAKPSDHQVVSHDKDEECDDENFRLYENFFYGRAVPVDKREAAKYCKLSADSGNAKAMLAYGDLLYNGDGTSTNKKEALKYFQQSAEQGNTSAMHKLGQMLSRGDTVKVNKKEAAKYYKRAADMGDIESMIDYGLMLYNGDGIDVDKEEASHYYRNAADQGYIEAMVNYGQMRLRGDGVEMDKEEAAKYYKMAADSGYIEAMFHYALMLYNGNGVKSDKKEAARYYKMAADKGYIEAVLNYSLMLYNGDGIESNKVDTARYYKMAADKGYIEPMFNYGRMLFRGEGVSVNKKEAVRYCKKAADKGYVEAMFYYAWMMENGNGVDAPDKKEAVKYYKMAAEKGHKAASFNVHWISSKASNTSSDKKGLMNYIKKAFHKG
ncbi:hypothetical protein M9Y10_010233 [Tritrichomonas musculus]|uniref:Protein kinase domain-containing protein n=1 Tax=Tritrichomonas musculus TaxID=1915356 RepID=A0ABR2IRR1_9EUKA